MLGESIAPREYIGLLTCTAATDPVRLHSVAREPVRLCSREPRRRPSPEAKEHCRLRLRPKMKLAKPKHQVFKSVAPGKRRGRGHALGGPRNESDDAPPEKRLRPMSGTTKTGGVVLTPCAVPSDAGGVLSHFPRGLQFDSAGGTNYARHMVVGVGGQQLGRCQGYQALSVALMAQGDYAKNLIKNPKFPVRLAELILRREKCQLTRFAQAQHRDDERMWILGSDLAPTLCGLTHRVPGWLNKTMGLCFRCSQLWGQTCQIDANILPIQPIVKITFLWPGNKTILYIFVPGSAGTYCNMSCVWKLSETYFWTHGI